MKRPNEIQVVCLLGILELAFLVNIWNEPSVGEIHKTFIFVIHAAAQ